MNYFAHLIAAFLIAYGLLFAVHIAYPVQIPFDLKTIAVVSLGALLPDADHSKTKVFKLFAFLFLLAATLFIHSIFFPDNEDGVEFTKTTSSVTGLAIIPANATNWVYSFGIALVLLGVVFLLKPRHRTVTHSVPAAFLFAIAMFLLTKSVLISGMGFVAFCSHLMLDSF